MSAPRNLLVKLQALDPILIVLWEGTRSIFIPARDFYILDQVVEDDLNRKLCRLHQPLQFSFISLAHHRQKVVNGAFALVLAILSIKERHNEGTGPQKELILNVIALEQLQNLITALQLLHPVILIDKEFEVEFFIEKA